MFDLPDQKIVDLVAPDIERFFHGAAAAQRFAHEVR
jgi:hypothetical protein